MMLYLSCIFLPLCFRMRSANSLPLASSPPVPHRRRLCHICLAFSYLYAFACGLLILCRLLAPRLFPTDDDYVIFALRAYTQIKTLQIRLYHV